MRLITTVTGGSHQGMEAKPEFPYDDRSPTDGELFGIEAVYWSLPMADRFDHGLALSEVIISDRETVLFVDRELRARKDDYYDTADEKYRLWRFTVRHLSDQELIELRVAAEDHILRALGAMALSFRNAYQLEKKFVTLPPPDVW